MKILHVVEPFAGGIATFLKLLTEELGDDYHIIVHGERKDLADPDYVKKKFPKKNIRFIHWKSAQREINPVRDIKAYFELVKILRRFSDVDVVHLHSSKAGFLGRVVCRHLGIKNVIYTPNGAPFLIKNVAPVNTMLYNGFEKLAYLFGGRIICSSASEKDEYVKRGMDADYINNGTRISKQSFIRDKGYNSFRVVTSGRIVNQKNPEFFNEIAVAFADLKHFEFVWIGDGEDTAILNAPNIRVTGWLSNDGVSKEIAKADLYLSTSIFEGLPFAVIEAMSVGKCLLLSNCTGNIDLVKKGINGEIYTNKEEAINHIIYFYLNKEITESMGLNSIEICRDYFNIEVTAMRYRMEYQKVAGYQYKTENSVKIDILNRAMAQMASENR
jgi:glycosyltransferase involved in cell wall biosynthesis